MGWAREPRCVAVPGCGKGGMRLSNKGLICEPPCAPPLSATYASASIGSFSKRQETRPVHLERQHAREPFAPVNCLLWGQTRKSGGAIATSALPPTTDIPASGCDVRKVPTTDISRWVYPVKNAFGLSSDPSYSIQSVGLTCHAAKAAKPDRTQVVGHIGR